MTEPEHCPGCAGRGAITVNLGPMCRYREECQICGGSGSYLDAMTRILDGSAAQFHWINITKEKIERFKILARRQ